MGIAGCMAEQATDLEAFLARTRMSAEIDALRRQVREDRYHQFYVPLEWLLRG